jgi:hypothetical protein
MELWWRIEFDSAGAVVSARQVEVGAEDAALVRYVSALTEAEALTIAKAQVLEHLREKQREWHRNTKARNKGLGLCRCGRAREEGKERCARCLQEKRNHYAQKQGKPVVALEPTQVVTIDVRLTNCRLQALQDCRAAWSRAENIHEFAAWLRDEITSLQRKLSSAQPEARSA